MNKLGLLTQEILELKRSIGANAWLIGNRLNHIKDTKIYLEKYGMWSEYLEKEVDISSRSAERFMRIASEYESVKVAEWGVKKLDLLLSVDEFQRKELINISLPDDSFSDIKKKIYQLKQTNNPDVEYYVKTEEVLRETLEKLHEATDYLTSCYFKKTFETYLRHQVILNLWNEIQKEVNKHGNNEN